MQSWGLWLGHEVGELYTLCKDNVKWGWRGDLVLFSESSCLVPSKLTRQLSTEIKNSS